MKILVTGGSGFIGTNFIDLLEKKSCCIRNLDINEPKNTKHSRYFERIDINNYESLLSAMMDFQPDYVVHLAARTDLNGADLDSYLSNTIGVENIARCCKELPGIKRLILASTKLIAPTDAQVSDLTSYNPNTIYGESKALGEKIIESNKYLDNWIIVRPTSIWGPWSLGENQPYGKFFQIIKKGLYIHPAVVDQPKYFGYVENSCFQIYSLLVESPDDVLKKKFYLADYEIYDIKSWANLISAAFGRSSVRVLPKIFVFMAAYAGDFLKFLGYHSPPFSSFRLKNMMANTTKVPLTSIKKFVPNLPFNLNDGVKRTVTWINEND
ncbi:MAG: NAD(P)-dependent oxidoreductase [SAR86 cluster bacterium]|nr:NAD(P)-dependent oxidoreductase [SAR86 cluster bacterium]